MQTLLACKERIDKLFGLDEALGVIANHAGRGVNVEHVVIMMLDLSSPNTSAAARPLPILGECKFIEQCIGSDQNVFEVRGIAAHECFVAKLRRAAFL